MKKYDYIIKAYVKKHKKQKIYMVVGLILACALFTIISYVVSLEKEIAYNELYQNRGYYDIAMRSADGNEGYKLKNNIYTEMTDNIKENNDVKIFNTNKVIDLYSISKNALKNVFQNQIELIDGRFPEGNGEIILSKDVLEETAKKLGDKIKIGDTSYKIVGEYKFIGSYNSNVIVRSDSEEKLDYIGVGIVSESLHNYNQEYMIIKFKQGVSRKVITKILEENKINVLSENYKIQIKIEKVIGTIITGIINILTTIILMYGSINIGITEKEKYYSLLRCIGITKNKLMYLLLKENLRLGMISIPVGVFLGYCIVAFNKVRIIEILNYGIVSGNLIKGISLDERVIFKGIIMGSLMLLVSSIIPVIRLGKKSPIEGLKEVKRNRKARTGKNKLLKKLSYNGYLAYRNIKKNGRKFNLTIVMLSSIGIMFSLISGYYYFTKQYSDIEKKELGGNIIGFLDGDFNKVNELEKYIESVSKNKGQIITLNKLGAIGMSQKFRTDEPIDIVGCNEAGFNKIKERITGEKESNVNGKEIILVKGYRNNKDNILGKEKGEKVRLELEGNDKKVTLEGIYVGEIRDIELSKLGNANQDKIIIPLEKYKNIFKNLEEQGNEQFIEISFDISGIDKDNIKTIEKKAKALNLRFINKKEINENNQRYLNTFIRLIAILFGVIILNMMINMISNNYTNVSLRKKEFASIMAIGVERKRLKKILVLEGILTWIVSSIIAGVVSIIGITIIYSMFIIQGIGTDRFPPYWIGGLGILFMLPINMIVTLLPIKNMKIDSLAGVMREE